MTIAGLEFRNNRPTCRGYNRVEPLALRGSFVEQEGQIMSPRAAEITGFKPQLYTSCVWRPQGIVTRVEPQAGRFAPGREGQVIVCLVDINYGVP